MSEQALDTHVQDVIRAEQLGKTYAEGTLHTPVFDGLDFAVAKGETVAILGASGAGKSTLLHLLGGLDVPTSGEVYVAGQKMSALSDAARGRLRNTSLGFVYQFHHLLPEFTALENVMMPVLLAGEAVLAARQRAAVARALVNNPACVLGDEPTGNLDEATAANVFAQMLELNRAQGTSLVLVTHDRRLARKLDRVMELRQGKLHALAASEI